ncbi:MAG: redoxin domain-containing protein [Bacteroidales bacterium]|nr:redoxin domain-containing protein [Bacteroidales bacterium]
MIKKINILLLLLLFCNYIYAQNITIEGNAKSYAGDTLNIYVNDNYLTKDNKIISSAIVNQEGDFNFYININETQLAYIDLSVFVGYIFLEPKQNLTIVLPTKQQLRIEDQLNPYFKPIKFYVKCLNCLDDDLNILIPKFNELYNQALDTILFTSYKDFSKSSTDKIKKSISDKFPTKNKYFIDYKDYTFAMLDYTAYHRSKDDIVEKMFTNRDVLLNNPAYMDLFEEMFSNVLSGGQTSVISVKNIYSGIYDKSYNTLKHILMSDKKLSGNDLLTDYVILKGLYDSYYCDEYPKEYLIAVTDSLMLNSKHKQVKAIAQSLSQKFTKLMVGYPAPQFSLKDKNGNDFILQQQSKFVYITFFNPNSYTAQSEFELLKQIRTEFPPEVLTMVTIFVSSQQSEMQQFLNKNPDCNWSIVWYQGDNQLLRDYNVKAYPSYYMVNPEGNLIMNPAPSPTENFQPKFASLINDWKIYQARKQARENDKKLR